MHTGHALHVINITLTCNGRNKEKALYTVSKTIRCKRQTGYSNSVQGIRLGNNAWIVKQHLPYTISRLLTLDKFFIQKVV